MVGQKRSSKVYSSSAEFKLIKWSIYDVLDYDFLRAGGAITAEKHFQHFQQIPEYLKIQLWLNIYLLFCCMITS